MSVRLCVLVTMMILWSTALPVSAADSTFGRIVLYSGTSFDILTTQVGLQVGYQEFRERNPLFRNRAMGVTMPIATSLITDLVATRLKQPWLRYLVGAVHISAGGYNLQLLLAQRKAK